MTTPYDKYYLTENLFGAPYPELIEVFTKYPEKGRVLDLGCGQGRDAIALARLGYTVTGIDHSKIGIEQMNHVAQIENLSLVGRVDDIFKVEQLDNYEFILLDSMFHFAKKDKKKEVGFIHTLLSNIKNGCIVVICIQDTGHKVQTLNQALDHDEKLVRLVDKKFKYVFRDDAGAHQSETDYRMIVVKK